jgi:uncharacterized peroxidase-related enzyme
MSHLPVHSIASAPAASQPLLEEAKERFGFLPNLLGMLSSSPSALEGYLRLTELFSATAFSPAEQQLVLLAASAQNSCSYCVAAHTVIAGMEELDPMVIEAIRAGTPIPDQHLQALRQFTQDVISRDGWLEPEQVERFLSAGYSESQCLDVILGIALKTLSNYANHLAGTPLDSAFATAGWRDGHADR